MVMYQSSLFLLTYIEVCLRSWPTNKTFCLIEELEGLKKCKPYFGTENNNCIIMYGIHMLTAIYFCAIILPSNTQKHFSF